MDEALNLAEGDEEIFIIGGGKIFEVALEDALPRVNRLYVTWVEANVTGDTYFPKIDWNQWREISTERHSADERNEYDTTYCIYDRITQGN